MEIRIDTSSDVPIRRQLTDQVIFLITTDRLRDGDLMPSVRELARRLKVHHNTISDAYKELVDRKWLERRRGSRLMVISREKPAAAASLDDLINTTISTARELGYSLQDLRQRVRDRLLAAPPDHFLVIEQDDGLQELMCVELQEALKAPVEGCSREDLAANRGLAIGALAVTAQHAVREVAPLLPKERPVVPVAYSDADEHLKRVRALTKPSIVAVVSASRLFLEAARGVLAPAMGRRHEFQSVLLTAEDKKNAVAADVIFCDSIALNRMRSPRAIHYRLLQQSSIDYLSTAMKSYHSQFGGFVQRTIRKRTTGVP